MIIYSGYIYLWYDTKAKLFYLGGHKGKVEDSYICSSKNMKRAYELRPETFRMKVLQYINGSVEDIRLAEQNWLNLIKDKELLLSKNVKSGTARYYNVKKISCGGSHKGHKKNRTKPAWNKGLKNVQEYSLDFKQNLSTKKKEYWLNKLGPISEHKCLICGKLEEIRSKTRKFCSRSCASKYKIKVRRGDWTPGHP